MDLIESDSPGGGITIREPITKAMWISALLVASQSFLFGYVFSCLNSCLVSGDNSKPEDCYHHTDSSCPKGTIYNDLNLTPIEAQVATSLVVLGAWLGCMIGSKPSEKYGRRLTLLANTAFFIIGAILSASGNYYCLFIGKLLSGFGVGVVSVVAPVLLSEIASEDTKGTITTLHQVMVTLAIFVASMVAYGFVTYVDHGWQYVQGFALIPAVMFVALQQWVPESPKWLVSQNRIDEATATLKRLRSTAEQAAFVGEEIQNMRGDTDGEDEATWSEVFACKKAVIIGCGLMFFQTMTGINSVIFYSTTIFGFAGFKESILGTTSVGVVNFLSTIGSAYIIDKVGRKVLLVIGTNIMMFALVALSTVLIAGDNIGSATQGALAVVFVLVYIVGFAMGLGAVVWVLMSEIMPTRLRVKAVSLFLSINWGFNLLIGLLTLTTIDGLGGVQPSMSDDETNAAEKKGVAYLYYIFAAFALLTVLFLQFYVPETRGKTPEDLMDTKKPLLSLQDNDETHMTGRRSGGGAGKKDIISVTTTSPLNKY